RTARAAERFRDAEQVRRRLLDLTESLDVRDQSRRLERELESRWHTLRPLPKRRLVRQAIERVVQLDRVEPLRVVRQHVGLLHLLRIEGASPFLVAEAARSRADTHVRSPS